MENGKADRITGRGDIGEALLSMSSLFPQDFLSNARPKRRKKDVLDLWLIYLARATYPDPDPQSSLH